MKKLSTLLLAVIIFLAPFTFMYLVWLYPDVLLLVLGILAGALLMALAYDIAKTIIK